MTIGQIIDYVFEQSRGRIYQVKDIHIDDYRVTFTFHVPAERSEVRRHISRALDWSEIQSGKFTADNFIKAIEDYFSIKASLT